MKNKSIIIICAVALAALIVVVLGKDMWFGGFHFGTPKAGPLPSGATWVRVTATIDKDSYLIGEEIVIEFSFQNSSTEMFQIEPFPPKIMVMPSLQYGLIIREFPEGMGTKSLEPGEVANYTLTWDQRDKQSQQVPAGCYKLALGNINAWNQRFMLTLESPVEVVVTLPGASSPDYPNHGINTTNVEPRPGESVTIVSGSMVRYTIDDLVEKSDTVVIGKVVDIFPSREVDEPLWIIITDVVIEVERYLYGQPQSPYIAVMVPGGRVGEKAMLVDGQLVFNLGEEVALFLHRLQSEITPPDGFQRAEYYMVAGSMQGKPGYSDGIMVTWEGERFTVSEVEQKIASIYGAE